MRGTDPPGMCGGGYGQEKTRRVVEYAAATARDRGVGSWHWLGSASGLRTRQHVDHGRCPAAVKPEGTCNGRLPARNHDTWTGSRRVVPVVRWGSPLQHTTFGEQPGRTRSASFVQSTRSLRGSRIRSSRTAAGETPWFTRLSSQAPVRTSGDIMRTPIDRLCNDRGSSRAGGPLASGPTESAAACRPTARPRNCSASATRLRPTPRSTVRPTTPRSSGPRYANPDATAAPERYFTSEKPNYVLLFGYDPPRVPREV